MRLDRNTAVLVAMSADRPLDFGSWLKERRKGLDLRQKDLARVVGCSIETIIKLESGKRRPSNQVAERLAQALGIPVSEIPAFTEFAREQPRQSNTPDSLPASEPVPGFSILSPWRRLRYPAELAQRPNNLPVEVNSFVGRKQLITTACNLLLRPGVRLLTLTGAPGIGKTRLGLQVAAYMLEIFDDGVFLISLASATGFQAAAGAIAQALGVRDAPRKAVVENLKTHLRDKRMLLILDNYEQLIPSAVTLPVELLRAAPGLKILITSRAVLHVYGEHELQVPPMSLPGRSRAARPDTLTSYEAVQLFVERAVSANAHFTLSGTNAQVVADICAWLEGIPLAIELAAARVKPLSLEEILQRLTGRDPNAQTLPGVRAQLRTEKGTEKEGSGARASLVVLTRGPRDVPARHRSLRNAIDWSYQLLNAEEQRLFRQLSVFVGGCTLDAIRAVAVVVEGAETRSEATELGDATDEMKIEVSRSQGSNLQPSNLQPATQSDASLLDTLRSLVEKSLVNQTEDPISKQPRFYMLELIREYGLEQLTATGELDITRHRHASYFLDLATKAEPQLRGPEQGIWLNRLDRDHDNLRAALQVLEESADIGAMLRMAEALGVFWLIKGYLSEGREHLGRVLSRAELAGLEHVQPGYTKHLSPALVAYAKTMQTAGVLAWRQDENSQARALTEKSLDIARRLGNKDIMTLALNTLGLLALDSGDYASARSIYRECLSLSKEIGKTRLVSACLTNLGHVALYQGEYAEAQQLFEQGLEIDIKSEDKLSMVRSLASLGKVAWCRADYATARSHRARGLQIAEDIGDRWGIAISLAGLGKVALRQHNDIEAWSLLKESLTLSRELGSKSFTAECLVGLAEVWGIRASALPQEELQRKEHAERAAMLLGTVQFTREAMHETLALPDVENFERIVVATRGMLGEQAFLNALQRGRDLSLEQSTELALAELAGA